MDFLTIGTPSVNGRVAMVRNSPVRTTAFLKLATQFLVKVLDQKIKRLYSHPILDMLSYDIDVNIVAGVNVTD